MPNNIVQSFAQKTGKSTAEVEKLWKEAKKATGDMFGGFQDGNEKHYKYAVGVLKNMLGIKESIDYRSFIQFDGNAKEFLENY